LKQLQIKSSIIFSYFKVINKKPNIQIKHTGASINADGAPLEFKIRSLLGVA
jgi:hypothetical protein